MKAIPSSDKKKGFARNLTIHMAGPLWYLMKVEGQKKCIDNWVILRHPRGSPLASAEFLTLLVVHLLVKAKVDSSSTEFFFFFFLLSNHKP